MQPIEAVPEPQFLNLEYIFSVIYRIFAKILSFIFSFTFLGVLKVLASLVIIFLIASIIYSLVRIYEMQKEAKQKAKSVVFGPPPPLPTTGIHVETAKGQNPMWQHIREQILSDNPSEWRLGIIEADIYLDRTLDSMGYHGDTLNDKFKQLTPTILPSLSLVQEAHGVRNRIAHDGAAYTLTMPEARRVMSSYEIAFRDLGVID